MTTHPRRNYAAKIKTSIALAPEILEALKAEATRQDRSVSYLIERICEREVGFIRGRHAK